MERRPCEPRKSKRDNERVNMRSEFGASAISKYIYMYIIYFRRRCRCITSIIIIIINNNGIVDQKKSGAKPRDRAGR